MEVSFVVPDLRRLDELKSEAIALAFFEDERPLRGAMGLLDWRLCGALSRLILRGRASGALERVAQRFRLTPLELARLREPSALPACPLDDLDRGAPPLGSLLRVDPAVEPDLEQDLHPRLDVEGAIDK